MFTNKKVTVVGSGISGIAAAKLYYIKMLRSLYTIVMQHWI